MEMHEIYLVSSIHISLPIPLNEVNREWAKGTDDERSGSGMGCESKRHGEPRDRRHERDTKWRDEWRVARLSSFMFLVSLTLPLLSPRRAHEWSEWGNETNEERRETEWVTRGRDGWEWDGNGKRPTAPHSSLRLSLRSFLGSHVTRLISSSSLHIETRE